MTWKTTREPGTWKDVRIGAWEGRRLTHQRLQLGRKGKAEVTVHAKLGGEAATYGL